jgi:hypothetical protein
VARAAGVVAAGEVVSGIVATATPSRVIFVLTPIPTTVGRHLSAGALFHRPRATAGMPLLQDTPQRHAVVNSAFGLTQGAKHLLPATLNGNLPVAAPPCGLFRADEWL